MITFRMTTMIRFKDHMFLLQIAYLENSSYRPLHKLLKNANFVLNAQVPAQILRMTKAPLQGEKSTQHSTE